MCGRFALNATAEALEGHYGLTVPEEYVARFNIAPGSPLLAITEQSLTFFKWGLIPGWMRQIKPGRQMINARVETVTDKPSFKHAFKRRRCLIPVSGFYEWKTESGYKQPYYGTLNQSLFSFAGIWEHWQDGLGNELQTCAVLTTQATGGMARIHQRMPVVIRPENYVDWLNHRNEEVNKAQNCIALLNAGWHFYPVTTAVNSASNDFKELTEIMVK